MLTLTPTTYVIGTDATIRAVSTVSIFPANMLLFANFATDEDAIIAPGALLTGTLIGGATIASGKLNMKGGSSGDALKWAAFADNAFSSMLQTGTIRVKYTPDYTGTPATQQEILCIGDGAGGSRVSIVHNLSGGLNAEANTPAGLIGFLSMFWQPTSGVEYEIEIDYDFTNGAHSLFVDGVELNTGSILGDRSSFNMKDVSTGTFTGAAAGTPDFELDDVELFNTVQHTAAYTPATAAPVILTPSAVLSKNQRDKIIEILGVIKPEGGNAFDFAILKSDSQLMDAGKHFIRAVAQAAALTYTDLGEDVLYVEHGPGVA